MRRVSNPDYDKIGTQGAVALAEIIDIEVNNGKYVIVAYTHEFYPRFMGDMFYSIELETPPPVGIGGSCRVTMWDQDEYYMEVEGVGRC